MPAISRRFSILRLWPAAIVVAALLLAGAGSTQHASAGVEFIVNDTGDQSDAVAGGACDVDTGTNGNQCTLRAALELAITGTFIHFDLPDCPGAGCTISPVTNLPSVDDPNIVIDATTEPDYAGTPIVTLNGSGGATDGLTLADDNLAVRGLIIHNFSGSGILASFSGYLGGWIIENNVIVNNGGAGMGLPPGNGTKGVNQIDHNFISNNALGGIAASSCPEPTAITSNILTNHNGSGISAIQICGPGHEVHFNRIVGNDVGIDDLGFAEQTNGENNWWGCNGGPNTSGCDTLGTDGITDADPWLVMTFGASPDAIQTGETSTLTADFTHNSDAADTSGSGLLPDGIQVIFHTDLGSVGSPSVLKPTANGVAVATLTADAGPGTAHVSATLDNETQNDQVVITQASPTPSPLPTASPSPTPTETATETPTETPADTGTPTVTPTSTVPLLPIQGDVNCDGVVDEQDALIVLLVVGGFPAPTPPLPCLPVGSGVPRAGDVNCDGVIDFKDVIAILAYKAGKPKPAPTLCPPIGQVLPI